MEKYYKVIYQSNPIGKEKIILELTTFDKEAYEKDKQLKNQRQFIAIEGTQHEFKNYFELQYFENKISKYIDKFYEDKFKELMQIIKSQQEEIIALRQTTAMPVIKFNQVKYEV